MPYQIVKNNDKSFSVINLNTKHLFSKHTTKEKAMKQLKLLEMIDVGKKEKRIRRNTF